MGGELQSHVLWAWILYYSYQGKVDAEELLQEAFLSAIEGRRKCPRDVDIVRFLAEAMRSLASSKMKSLERKPELKLLLPDGDKNELPYDFPSGEPNAEQAILSSQEVEGIRAAILNLIPSTSWLERIARRWKVLGPRF